MATASLCRTHNYYVWDSDKSKQSKSKHNRKVSRELRIAMKRRAELQAQVNRLHRLIYGN